MDNGGTDTVDRFIKLIFIFTGRNDFYVQYNVYTTYGISRNKWGATGTGHMTCETCGRTRRPSFFTSFNRAGVGGHGPFGPPPRSTTPARSNCFILTHSFAEKRSHLTRGLLICIIPTFFSVININLTTFKMSFVPSSVVECLSC